jgi:hypothetical protein
MFHTRKKQCPRSTINSTVCTLSYPGQQGPAIHLRPTRHDVCVYLYLFAHSSWLQDASCVIFYSTGREARSSLPHNRSQIVYLDIQLLLTQDLISTDELVWYQTDSSLQHGQASLKKHEASPLTQRGL